MIHIVTSIGVDYKAVARFFTRPITSFLPNRHDKDENINEPMLLPVITSKM